MSLENHIDQRIDTIREALSSHAKRAKCKPWINESFMYFAVKYKSVKKLLATCTTIEINILLLYMSLDDDVETIRFLCKHYEVNVNYAEPKLGITALHLCAFNDNLNSVRYLITRGADVDFNQTYTPFHYVAYGNSYNVAQYFVQLGVKQLVSKENNETVLRVAILYNATLVLSLLVANNEELNQLDAYGRAAIHYAATKSEPSCLNILLQEGWSCDVDLRNDIGKTALHLAAEAGCERNILLLLEAKANHEIRDHQGYTALHLAICNHQLECAKLLLQNGADPNTENNENQSSLHLALSKSPINYDIIELLLTYNANVNQVDKYSCTPLHIASLKELSRCVNLLIMHDADLSAKTKEDISALSIIQHNTPTCLNVFKRNLDAYINLDKDEKEFYPYEKILKLNFFPLLQHSRHIEISYLNFFVNEGYKEILDHPLCQSFLHFKWLKIRKYYAVRLLLYLVYMLILTCWVMTSLAYNCYNELHGHMRNSSLCVTELYDFFYRYPIMFDIQRYTLVTFILLELIRKFTMLLSYQSKQFFTKENLVDWCLILAVLATLFVCTGRTYSWQSYLGAFAIFCGWSNLMLMMGQLPIFGVYIEMFTSVQNQVFKLLLIYVCMLVGFAMSFCVIFPQSESFNRPNIALIKVLVMMTGELNFKDFFFSFNETIVQTSLSNEERCSTWVLLQISSQILFVLFVLFVTITLMNLLIGIAVNDIKDLRKTAELAILVRQTKLIYNMEVALSFTRLSKCLLSRLQYSIMISSFQFLTYQIISPLNPRETNLPRNILSAIYRVAKKERHNNFELTHDSGYYAKECLKSDASGTCRRNDSDEITSTGDYKRFKNDMAKLMKICQENEALLNKLVNVQDDALIYDEL